MVVTCDIQFDNNPEGIYFSGQVVRGCITLQANKPKKVNGVILKMHGFAYTRWESRSERSKDSHDRRTSTTETTTYSGYENYFSSLTNLLVSSTNSLGKRTSTTETTTHSGYEIYFSSCTTLLAGGTNLVIEPGIHTFSFSCPIPAICPSSFEGHYGHIRYTAQVALSRPWKFDEKYTKGFTVLQLLDLNFEGPLLLRPSDIEDQKVFCCGPFKSGPLKLHVDLPHSGFVPGENIPVNVIISNDSRVPVEEIRVLLEMHVKYFCEGSLSTEYQIVPVVQRQGPGVLQYCKKSFTYYLVVPATPSTSQNRCRLIQIYYQVVVEARVKGTHKNQRVTVPVTIGNVPLKGVIQQQPTSSSPGGLQFGEMMQHNVEVVATLENGAASIGEEVSPTPPWQADSNMPPPNYVEAMHMQHAKITENEDHDYGPTEFSPRYPVFNIPSPTAPAQDEREVIRESTWL